jgi:uncharacterized protein (DUF3820 family)
MKSSKSHSGDFIIPFGKYRGKSLNGISELDNSYIVWLSDSGALLIDSQFIEALKHDILAEEPELKDIIDEHYYDIH